MLDVRPTPGYSDPIGRHLEGADRQKNLEGPLVVDAVAVPSATYEQAQLVGTDVTAKKDEAVGRADLDKPAEPRAVRPNLFERLRRRFPGR